MGRVHGVRGEVCWDVGGGEESCGKRYGVGVGKCVRVWGGGKERCVGSGEVWGGVRESVPVWGEWVKDVGEEWGKSRSLGCGAPTHLILSHFPHLPHLTFPYISFYRYLPHTPAHFPTPPLMPLSTSTLPPPSPQHIFLLSPHIYPNVLKVWRSYHVTKFLWRSY